MKDKLLKAIGPIIVLPQPDLRPSLWVNCCTGDCASVLLSKKYILVKDMNVYIYNAGGAASTAATGKVQFFDVFSNSNKTLTFSVSAVSSKGWGTVTPNKFTGPYLIKTDQGITASVTFSAAGTTKTNTYKATGCSVLY